MPLPILNLRTLSLNTASKARLSASSLPEALRIELKAGRRMRGSWVNVGSGGELFGETFGKTGGGSVSKEEKDYARVTLAGWEGWALSHGPWSCVYRAVVGWPQPEFIPGCWLRVSTRTCVPGHLNNPDGVLSLVVETDTVNHQDVFSNGECAFHYTTTGGRRRESREFLEASSLKMTDCTSGEAEVGEVERLESTMWLDEEQGEVVWRVTASMPCPLTPGVKLTYCREFQCEDWGEDSDWQDPLADLADAQDPELRKPKPW